jgi:hypothetical protein
MVKHVLLYGYTGLTSNIEDSNHLNELLEPMKIKGVISPEPIYGLDYIINQEDFENNHSDIPEPHKNHIERLVVPHPDWDAERRFYSERHPEWSEEELDDVIETDKLADSGIAPPDSPMFGVFIYKDINKLEENMKVFCEQYDFSYFVYDLD